MCEVLYCRDPHGGYLLDLVVLMVALYETAGLRKGDSGVGWTRQMMGHEQARLTTYAIASLARTCSYTEPYISEFGSETGRLPPMESGADGAHPESRVGITAL